MNELTAGGTSSGWKAGFVWSAPVVRGALGIVVLWLCWGAAGLSGGHSPSYVRAQETGPARLLIDLDVDGGACRTIESSLQVSTGNVVRAAVCLDNPGSVPVAAFNYRLTYDDRILHAAEVPDSGTGLDDNPDANAGSTTFSSPDLGGGWDCSAGVGSFPVGDEDPAAGVTGGVAYSGGCGSVAGPNTLLHGPLQVITFSAASAGDVRLSLTRASVIDDELVEVGSCRPAIDVAIACVDARLTVTGAPIEATAGTGVTASPAAASTPDLSVTAQPVATCPAGQECDDVTTPAAVRTGADEGSPVDADGQPGGALTTPGSARKTPSVGAGGSGNLAPDADEDADHGGGFAGRWLLVVLGVVAGVAVIGGAAYIARWRQNRN